MSWRKKADIKTTDMPEEMQEDAVNFCIQAVEKYTIEKDIASFIKKEYEKKYSPSWHCIVGKDYGCFITHESHHFMYLSVKQFAILLFKSGNNG